MMAGSIDDIKFKHGV